MGDEPGKPAHGPPRVRPFEKHDPIKSGDAPILEDSGIPAGSTALQKGPWQATFSEAKPELEAWLAGLRYLQQRRASPEHVADANRVLVEAESRDVLAESSGQEQRSVLRQLARPCVVVLGGVEIN